MFQGLTKGSSEGGFTLIELLIVIGIIAILAAIVIVAVNPAQQFAQARDAQRQSNVNAILNAVHQRAIDNEGVWDGPPIPTTATTIASSSAVSGLCDTITPTYIAEMPLDPTSPDETFDSCSNYNTGYTIRKATAGRYEVAAPNAETRTISVTQ